MHTNSPSSCYTFIGAEPGDRVGLLTSGVPGFLITRIDRKDMTDAEVRELVVALNSSCGVSEEQAALMYRQSISGCRRARAPESLQ